MIGAVSVFHSHIGVLNLGFCKEPLAGCIKKGRRGTVAAHQPDPRPARGQHESAHDWRVPQVDVLLDKLVRWQRPQQTSSFRP